MSLALLPVGKPARVTAIRCSKGGYRLMEMGLIEGAEVELIGRAPLGDPLHLRVGDFHLSLRTRDAESIDVA